MTPCSDAPFSPGELPSTWLPVDLGLAQRDHVHALMSSRQHGISQPPYAQCNLGDHVQDDPRAVAHNRGILASHMGARPVWMTQVHGNEVIRLRHGAFADGVQPHADGALTTEPGLACTVMVADCLPVLLAAPQGRGVAALHAGWRGLAGAGGMKGRGIVRTGVQALCEATGADPGDMYAWLGPCIGPSQFEVGPDVLAGFGVDPADWLRSAVVHPRFQFRGGEQSNPQLHQAKWLADLPGLARDLLRSLGVQAITGGQWCTVSAPSRFFSYRRDGVTGRQAASICLR